ncbi:MAG: cation diffusion facilitator family transporter [Oscillospiraceae bacterium]
MKKQRTDKEIAIHTSRVSIIVNVLLSIGKLIVGFVAHSGAMISDAIHSASDVFSTFIVMIGVSLSNKKSDKDHQYGHERFECAASIVLAVILAITGLEIGASGLGKIFGGNYGELAIPGKAALIVAVISIVTKEAMYWYTRAAAKKICSDALMADAWHHRSDALSSIGAFIGILGSRLGYPVLDPVASVFICLCILKVSVDIFKEAMNKMVDKSCSNEVTEEIRSAAENVEGVEAVDLLRTRLFGSKIYVDVEIAADGNKTLWETHQIAENVHEKIENDFPDVKHCMVHVNPYEGEK